MLNDVSDLDSLHSYADHAHSALLNERSHGSPSSTLMMARSVAVLICISYIVTPVTGARNSFVYPRASEGQEVSSSLHGQLHTRSEQATQLHASSGERNQAGPANVLIKYIVPPQIQQEFIEIFQEVKDATIHESGCEDYNLLKPITDNVSFYVYGKWDSKEAYAEHFRSDHTKKMLEFDQDKGIVFYIQPLLVVD